MPSDPIWTYFDAQHKFILERMRKVFLNSLIVVKSIQYPFVRLLFLLMCYRAASTVG
jgi:hypothetical protein